LRKDGPTFREAESGPALTCPRARPIRVVEIAASISTESVNNFAKLWISQDRRLRLVR